jgi:tetratricopeptide (TPR) repeat protein
MSHNTEQESQRPWLGWMEKVSIAGAFVGSAASVMTQQVVYASVPLAMAAVLNFTQRQKLQGEIQQHRTAVELLTANSKATEQLLMIQLNHTRNDLQELITSESATTAAMAQIQMLQLNKFQQTTEAALDYLQSAVEHLQTDAEALTHQQAELLESTFEAGYSRRGLEFEKQGDFNAAIAAHTEALRLNPNYVEALVYRGSAYARVGKKQLAIADLRTATKMFFERGDLENYHKARALSEEIHASNQSIAPEPVAQEERIVVDELFV